MIDNAVDNAQQIANLARGFDDPRRVRILLALMDGRALSASHLATEAGIAPSTASAHLKQLLAAGLIVESPAPPHHGRHRFFALAGEDVAAVCETLAAVSSDTTIRSLQPGTHDAALRAARTCYDHLAGRLGVALLDAMLGAELLRSHDGGFALTGRGEQQFERFGIDLDGLRHAHRPLIRHCTDWSEQRAHLSGGLGSAVLNQITGRGWLARPTGNRTLFITPLGVDGFRTWFGLDTGAIKTLAQAI